jgi:putative transposase
MKRNSIRLRNFDYGSSGAYFITICSYQRDHIFGIIEQEKMQLNDLGTIILEEWQRMNELCKNIILDEFVVMPNHIHGIICIQPAVAGLASPDSPMLLSTARKELLLSQTKASLTPSNAPTNSLGAIIGGFKSAVSRVARVHLHNPHLQVWQRNYFERIIRNDRELNAVREYIVANPSNWFIDLEARSDVALHDLVFSWLEVAA